MRNPPPNDASTRSEGRVRQEEALAGALFRLSAHKPYVAGDILGIIRPEMCLSPQVKAVFQAVETVRVRGEEPDLVSVGRELAVMGAKGRGGTNINADLVEFSMGSDLFSEPAAMLAARKIAEEHAKDLAVLDLGEAMAALGTFGAPVDLAVSGILRAKDALEGCGGNPLPDLSVMLDEYASGLDKPTARPVPSPWTPVTRILRGGILPGELAILSARPSVGKSALSLNWAWSVACSGRTAQIHSLEMQRGQLIERLCANVGGIPLGDFRTGLTPKQKDLARGTLAKMRGVPLEVYDDTRCTVGEIRRRIRLSQRKGEIGLVVVDYLQLLNPEHRSNSREREVAEMSRGLKQLAGELSVPVLLLAQLNRKSEEGKRKPMLSDLRESGAIEQDADIVMFLHQARSVGNWNPNEPVKLIVAKGRSSGVGEEDLIFRRPHQRFEESSEQAFAQAEKEDMARSYHYTELGQDDLA